MRGRLKKQKNKEKEENWIREGINEIIVPEMNCKCKEICIFNKIDKTIQCGICN